MAVEIQYQPVKAHYFRGLKSQYCRLHDEGQRIGAPRLLAAWVSYPYMSSEWPVNIPILCNLN